MPNNFIKPAPGMSKNRMIRAGLLFLISAAAVFAYFTRPDLRLNEIAFYISLPVLVALACTYFIKPKTRTGSNMLNLSLGLILFGILAGEDSIYVIRAAPLFYAGVIGFGLWKVRAQRA